MKNVIGHSLYAVSGKLWRFSSIITITNRERKTMTAGNWTYSGTMDHKPSKREKEHRILARKAAEKGIVLLKNQGILPLSLSLPVALLGRGGEKTVKGGTGSGDVNNRENISILRALEEAGVTITSTDWIRDYHNRYENARLTWKEKVLEDAKKAENPFDAYAENPFAMPEGRLISDKNLQGAKAVIYVISRISGEGKDRRREKGDYYLSQNEEEDLLYLHEKQVPVILILNSGGPVELTDILEKAENIQAVLYISQLGQEGGYAVADILLGKAVPEGKLTSTWARRYEDYPSARTFGYLNGDLEKDEYKEGIYIGYRYFDTFSVRPLFPFGYGLSYTSFSIGFQGLEIGEKNIELTVSVKNTGECYSGREVVQVYITAPQNGEGKEYKRLAGFAKTGLLQPGQEQEIKIRIEQKELASFREESHQWSIDKGSYGLWIGNSGASLILAAKITVSETKVIENTHRVCPKQRDFSDLQPSAASGDEMDLWKEEKSDFVPSYRFMPMKEEKKTYVAPPDQDHPVEDLLPLLYGNITWGASNLGSAGTRVPGSAGETTRALEEKYGIPSMIMADGPAGIRLRQSYQVERKTGEVYGIGVLGALENGFLEPEKHHENADVYYQYCTAFPVGTALAQTWDLELMKEFGEAIGKEMEEFHINLWLAPGMNIQRNPLCGRNFEYYSEDPFLSGKLAAAVTLGVQSRKGCGVTIKHFACNNQEDNRMGVDACVSERALREIYFRGFEIAIKESNPVAIMSSYNLINGVHAANSRDLCTVLAREEWGFDGVIMSDWNTTVPEDGSIPWECAAAGNDIIMPGNAEDDKNIREAYAKGLLSEQTIRECAGRILYMIKRLS